MQAAPSYVRGESRSRTIVPTDPHKTLNARCSRKKVRAASAVGDKYHKENLLTSSAGSMHMTTPTEPLLRYLRRLTASSDHNASDADLVARIATQHDETAFTTLLVRHGPMVHGVCRRILRDSNDIEDVFQATFIVFARKAGSLRRPEALASWLYGTARRLASAAAPHRLPPSPTRCASLALCYSAVPNRPVGRSKRPRIAAGAGRGNGTPTGEVSSAADLVSLGGADE